LAHGKDPVARKRMPQGNNSRKTPAKKILTRVGDLVEFHVSSPDRELSYLSCLRRFFSKIQSPSLSRQMTFICRMREVAVKTDVGRC
jgi:hypothetical protein